MKRPTLGDVAALAGVHTATASRALNPATAALVSGATAERISRAAATLGYEVNTVARGLRTSRSATVGVILPDITNALFPPMVRGVEDSLREHGFSAVMINTDNDPGRAQQAVDSMRARLVDGFVMATARRNDPTVEALALANVPLVLMNRVTDHVNVSTVEGEDEDGMRQSVNHLTALGHRRITHLAGPNTVSTGAHRAEAFRVHTLQAGLNPAECPVEPCRAYSAAAGEAAAQRALQTTHPPTAFVAGNDLIAIGALAALRAAKLSCPGDVSVVGFNDMPLMDVMSPALTTVRTPNYEIGRAAGRLVLELIRDATGSRTHLHLPTTLVVRQSCGPAPPSATRRRV